MTNILLSSTNSLTNVSSLSYARNPTPQDWQDKRMQTCSCSTCTCSIVSCMKKGQADASLENCDDCLTQVILIVYQSSIWCIQTIYELLFESFWQVLLYLRQELKYHCQKNHRQMKNIVSHDYVPQPQYRWRSKYQTYPVLPTATPLPTIQNKIKSTVHRKNNR